MELTRTYLIPAPQQRVYDAWVSSTTVIPPATAMDIDPQVGGHYRLYMQGEGFNAQNEGTFSVVDAPHRVVYTWEWNQDGEVTEIDVTFTPTQAGTEVRIVHTGFNTEESVTNHTLGWDSYIEGFIEFLGTTTA